MRFLITVFAGLAITVMGCVGTPKPAKQPARKGSCFELAGIWEFHYRNLGRIRQITLKIRRGQEGRYVAKTGDYFFALHDNINTVNVHHKKCSATATVELVGDYVRTKLVFSFVTPHKLLGKRADGQQPGEAIGYREGHIPDIKNPNIPEQSVFFGIGIDAGVFVRFARAQYRKNDWSDRADGYLVQRTPPVSAVVEPQPREAPPNAHETIWQVFDGQRLVCEGPIESYHTMGFARYGKRDDTCDHIHFRADYFTDPLPWRGKPYDMVDELDRLTANVVGRIKGCDKQRGFLWARRKQSEPPSVASWSPLGKDAEPVKRTQNSQVWNKLKQEVWRTENEEITTTSSSFQATWPGGQLWASVYLQTGETFAYSGTKEVGHWVLWKRAKPFVAINWDWPKFLFPRVIGDLDGDGVIDVIVIKAGVENDEIVWFRLSDGVLRSQDHMFILGNCPS